MRRALVISLLFFCAISPSYSRIRTKRSKRRTIPAGKPTVTDTSPPNWWSGLPNPMLLLHGTNLNDAQISSSVPGISIRRTRVSANGHWGFVWLDISSAQPQRFTLLVRTVRGRTPVPYELQKRHDPADGFHGFSSADVMYLVLPDRFADGDPSNDRLPQMQGTFDRTNPSAYHGGDLAGIESHLDYLQKLGVTTLWVAPLYAQGPLSAPDYSGYAPVDLYQVNPHFGTLQDYQNLAQAVHTRGMKLVLDTVMNHVGANSPWLLDPPAPDWFHGTVEQHLEATANFQPITNPHSPPAAYQAAVDGWFSDTLPDLNQSNPLVKQYLIQNAIWWVESGALDGLRLDLFPNVDRDFWQEFHTELIALYPQLTTVGEIFNPDPTVVSYFAGGVKHAGIDTGLSTPFDFPSFFALRAALTGTAPTGNAPMTKLTEIERQDWLYPHPEQLVTFFGNQDTARFASEPGVTTARMKLAFGLIATMRGMPQIYYGDEIAMPDVNDGDNRVDFPGGFPGDTNNAFTAASRTAPQEAMHAWVAGLLDLRAHHSELQTGAQQNLLVDDTGFVYTRFEAPSTGNAGPALAQGESMLVLLNKSDAPRTFHLDFSGTALQGVQALAPAWNTQEQVTVEDNTCDVNVGAEQLIVLEAHAASGASNTAASGQK